MNALTTLPIFAAKPETLWREVPLSSLTTLGVGGPAQWFWRPNSVQELQQGLLELHGIGLNPFVLGGGSNLLVRDGGIPGLCLQLGTGFGAWRSEGATLHAAANLELRSLVGIACRLGLSGLEFATGIPGAIGGAVKGNAGTKAGCIGDRIAAIDFIMPSGEFMRLDAAELEFGYRTARLPGGGVIAGVTLQLAAALPSSIRARCRQLFRERLQQQPWRQASAGCSFKNPPAQAAGQLIDQSGLKDYSIGGARVSDRHANFIVNTGNAEAADVLKLMEFISDRVMTIHGIKLEPEVIIAGEVAAGGYQDRWSDRRQETLRRPPSARPESMLSNALATGR